MTVEHSNHPRMIAWTLWSDDPRGDPSEGRSVGVVVEGTRYLWGLQGHPSD